LGFWTAARRRLIGLAAALGCLAASMGAPACAAPAMWLVRDSDSEVYLFGTMHALAPGVRWRTPAYEAAYQRADAIWFEADIDKLDATAIGALLARYGVDRGQRLSQRLADDDLRRLKQRTARARLSLDRFEQLRPWAAALALSTLPAGAGGQAVEHGPDLVVTRQARQANKAIRTFETAEDQVRMFAGLPEEIELQYLCDVLRGDDQLKGASLQKAWLDGDLALLGPGLLDPMRDERPAFYEMLLKRRNLGWTDTLTRELAGSGVALVNVGALHLLGEDGLPALLQGRGFTVTRIQ
jgi:uncharacterized protein